MSAATAAANADDIGRRSKEWFGFGKQAKEEHKPVKVGETAVFFTPLGDAYIMDSDGYVDKFTGTPALFSTLLQFEQENGTVNLGFRKNNASSSGLNMQGAPISQTKYAAQLEAANPIPPDFR